MTCFCFQVLSACLQQGHLCCIWWESQCFLHPNICPSSNWATVHHNWIAKRVSAAVLICQWLLFLLCTGEGERAKEEEKTHAWHNGHRFRGDNSTWPPLWVAFQHVFERFLCRKVKGHHQVQRCFMCEGRQCFPRPSFVARVCGTFPTSFICLFWDPLGWGWVEMCLQQRLQRLLVLKRNTSEITTTAWSTTLSTKKSRCWAVPVEGFFANGTSLVVSSWATFVVLGHRFLVLAIASYFWGAYCDWSVVVCRCC